jgi:hypothetical protein
MARFLREVAVRAAAPAYFYLLGHRDSSPVLPRHRFGALHPAASACCSEQNQHRSGLSIFILAYQRSPVR